MRLYLVRHARTAWNDKGLALGQIDVELDGEGEQQLLKLQDRFRSVSLDRILTSDLIRCRRTTDALVEVTGAKVEVRPELRERSFGEWERSNYDWVTQQLVEMAEREGVSYQLVRPPGGESHEDVWRRTEGIVEQMFNATDEAVALVTHGGTSNVLLAQLLHGHLVTTRSFQFDNAAVTELVRRPEANMLLIHYNDTSHLRVS